jgi:hypothetical protein
MAEGFVHTVHKNGNWINEIEGDEGALRGVHSTKQVAVTAGRAEAVASNTEHVIHDADGSIGERNSYGGDPAHRRG